MRSIAAFISAILFGVSTRFRLATAPIFVPSIASNSAWIIDIKKPDTTSAENFLFAGKFRCAEAQIASADFNGAWGFVDYQLFWLPPAVLTTKSTAL